MKIVINKCFGGFRLSNEAYEKLIEYGIPVRKYIKEKRDPNTRLYEKLKENEGEIIFDRKLTPQGEDKFNDLYYTLHLDDEDRYWDCWTSGNRSHPLIVKVVEELGEKAGSRFSKLIVVEVPDNVEWYIDDYDGLEHIAEKHETWG